MFKPVLALMNRARYLQKFAIILAVFMLPFCWLALDKLGGLYRELQDARDELQGLAVIEQYLPLYSSSLGLVGLQLVGQARESSELAAVINEQQQHLMLVARALNARLEDTSLAAYRVDENALASQAKVRGDLPVGILYAELLQGRPEHAARLRRIARDTHLSQDRDAEVGRAVELLLGTALPLYQALYQTRAFASYVTAYGYLESASRTSILGQAGDLEPFAQVPAGAEQARALIGEAAAQARDLYQQTIIAGYAASAYYDEDSTALWAERWQAYAPLIDRLDSATQLLLDDTAAILTARIAARERTLLGWGAALLLVIACLIYLFVGFYLSVRGSIRLITDATCRLADGDLRHSIRACARDELGDLAGDFNIMRERMRALIVEVVQFSDATHGKATQVSATASHSQLAATRQASELELISTAMVELVGSVQEISRSSHSTSDRASHASANCKDGGAKINRVMGSIDALFAELDESITTIVAVERESQEIARVVEMIRSVSQQTNLLALNAAIEAARAGEQGRGFAVVADQVRSLATHSQGLTGEIDGTIERLQREVGNAVRRIRCTHDRAGEVVHQARLAAEAFADITEGMSVIVQHNLQIAAAAEQQAAVVESVERNTREIRTLSGATRVSVDDMVRASDEVAELTGGLHRLVGQFKM
ncbi:methyl-accepting chemotaxis protein [Ectopseudomonas toyotomiensis]|uniref:Methyl-accepting chemotaxis protein n=1 Tax=Ectopseudomonas toyotomiensis TaxID=554344 RepID=A0ABD7DXC4_9GAMM|nr:methyl-accepting chemotaxis protein [Pseudomonas toyotomiensis]QSL92782.1 methyl-accepting chemotaxis protein [Pseudomonas toyotomiensis]